ncbi:hypothetical protein GN956_G2709 [Arapaima gigas]
MKARTSCNTSKRCRGSQTEGPSVWRRRCGSGEDSKSTPPAYGRRPRLWFPSLRPCDVTIGGILTGY